MEKMTGNQEALERLKIEILELEWEMFTTVPNEGGRAACQDDRVTFAIMRMSQMAIWSEEALASYREDLIEGKAQDRNLLTEKYGYMMEDTAPEQFKRIEHLLPGRSAEKRALVEELTAKQTAWMERFRMSHPCFAGQGRVIYQKDAGRFDTSIETYARGELSTYSERTLKLLKEQYLHLESVEVNPAIRIMDAEARAYGYRDARDAEAQLKVRFGFGEQE